MKNNKQQRKKNCVVLFVKAPVPGYVKTRLAKDIGNQKACNLYKIMTEKILQEIQKTDADYEIHYYPETSRHIIKDWLGSKEVLIPQQGDSLGPKMENALAITMNKGYRNVILTGSDIPDLTRDILEAGFRCLKKRPVLGPCIDGGYYLIGLNTRCFHSDYFENIHWSTQQVLKETLERMADKNFVPFLLPVLSDIDTLADFDRVLCKKYFSGFGVGDLL